MKALRDITRYERGIRTDRDQDMASYLLATCSVFLKINSFELGKLCVRGLSKL